MADIKLTDAEALVLVEFLSRFSDSEVLAIQHPAEERILWDMCAMLEKQVVELFDPRYHELLENARTVVASGEE